MSRISPFFEQAFRGMLADLGCGGEPQKPALEFEHEGKHVTAHLSITKPEGMKPGSIIVHPDVATDFAPIAAEYGLTLQTDPNQGKAVGIGWVPA